MKRSNLKQCGTMVFGVVLATSFILPASTALGQQLQDPAAQIKAAFDQAMAKPLNEQIPLLEALEQQIEQDIFQGRLAGKAKAKGLYYKYHLQKQLAKYPQAQQTYAAYIRSIKDSGNVQQADSTFIMDLGSWKRRGKIVHCASISETMAEEFAKEPAIMPP